MEAPCGEHGGRDFEVNALSMNLQQIQMHAWPIALGEIYDPCFWTIILHSIHTGCIRDHGDGIRLSSITMGFVPTWTEGRKAYHTLKAPMYKGGS